MRFPKTTQNLFTRQLTPNCIIRLNKKSLAILVFTLCSFSASSSNSDTQVDQTANSQRPIAAWNFAQGDSPNKNAEIVDWDGRHGGLESIPGENLRGIEFEYRGKKPLGDANSEWRYKLKRPLNVTWEYLRIFQPKNFYHRAITEIEAPVDLDASNWSVGDPIENERGMSAEIVYVDDEKLYIGKYRQRFDRNWGKGRKITNMRSNASFVSLESKFLETNNKLATQWQGRYSNAGVTVETQAILPAKGGEHGVGYCRPTINRSVSHRSSGTVVNQLKGKLAECFHPRDNGTAVELFIERRRSSSLKANDGSYQIWKRTENSDWTLIFSNTSVKIFQPNNNVFDNGYVFGWSNSGFHEDTSFYLLEWQLWDSRPSFLPSF